MSNSEQPYRTLTDEELMQRYRLGEAGGFEELHRRYAARVYGFLLKRLGRGRSADDVFQEAFLRVHRYRMRYDPSLPFVPWLFTITRNALIDFERKRVSREEREDAFDTEKVDRELQLAAAGAEVDPIPFRDRLAGLSDREKEVLILHLEQGLSFKEVGSWLRISSDNARQLSSRALRKLKLFWK